MDAILGSISLFPWNRETEGWLKCDGALLHVNQYVALFSLIGVQFGGDAQSNFALPNIPAIKTANGGEVNYYICANGIYPNLG